MDFHDLCPYSLSPSYFSFLYSLKLLGPLYPSLSAKLLRQSCSHLHTPALLFPPPVPLGTIPFWVLSLLVNYQGHRRLPSCQVQRCMSEPSFLTSHHHPSLLGTSILCLPGHRTHLFFEPLRPPSSAGASGDLREAAVLGLGVSPWPVTWKPHPFSDCPVSAARLSPLNSILLRSRPGRSSLVCV